MRARRSTTLPLAVNRWPVARQEAPAPSCRLLERIRRGHIRRLTSAEHLRADVEFIVATRAVRRYWCDRRQKQSWPKTATHGERAAHRARNKRARARVHTLTVAVVCDAQFSQLAHCAVAVVVVVASAFSAFELDKSHLAAASLSRAHTHTCTRPHVSRATASEQASERAPSQQKRLPPAERSASRHARATTPPFRFTRRRRRRRRLPPHLRSLV